MIATAAAAAGIAVCAAGAITFLVSARLTRAYPPIGDTREIDGVSMHFVDRPAADGDSGAPPILFIHGASGNLRDQLVPFGHALSAHRLIFVDRPGHGHSARGGPTSADPARQADLIAGLLRRLGVDKVIVVGHSLGASITAAFALGFPERIAGLVFVSPATHPWGGGLPWHHRLVDLPVVGRLFALTLALPIGYALMPRFVADTFVPEMPPARYMDQIAGYLVLRPANFLSNSRDVTGLEAHVAAMAPRYPSIRVPTIIVTGDSDPIVYKHVHSDGLHRDISGSKLVVLPGVGHMPHHTATAAVLAAIEEIAARAVPQPGSATIITQNT